MPLALLGVAVIFLVALDVIFSLAVMMTYREPDEWVLKSWTCHHCGAEVGHFTMTLSLWRFVTHRCDDNLCS